MQFMFLVGVFLVSWKIPVTEGFFAREVDSVRNYTQTNN
jgi:hypothetical protein